MADMEKISNGYKKYKDYYDDALTSGNFWLRIYNQIVWGIDDKDYVEKVIDYIPEAFKGKMLDVPVGTGVHTFRRYKKMPEAHITALDYSKDMLQKAKERIGQYENVDLMQGDVGALPFNDGHFDLVLSMNGFHAFPDKIRAFEETGRVLKDNGIFCGCFYVKGQRKTTDMIINSLYVKKGWFTPPFYTLEELLGILKAKYKEVTLTNVKSIACFYCIK